MHGFNKITVPLCEPILAEAMTVVKIPSLNDRQEKALDFWCAFGLIGAEAVPRGF
jgi:hypothetical protein